MIFCSVVISLGSLFVVNRNHDCRSSSICVGGTFALYSLLCRHAKVRTIPNQHRTDEELTTYSRNTVHEHSFAAKTKTWLEKTALRKTSLLILVLVGTCMVIGDGILTPAISGRYVCLLTSSFILKENYIYGFINGKLIRENKKVMKAVGNRTLTNLKLLYLYQIILVWPLENSITENYTLLKNDACNIIFSLI